VSAACDEPSAALGERPRMSRHALLMPARSSGYHGLELWLLLYALVGLGCWWFVHRDVVPIVMVSSVDLAIGRGMPLLSDEISQMPTLTIQQDVQDLSELIVAGGAAVGVDAGPDGVRILYRPDSHGNAPTLVNHLTVRLQDAELQVVMGPAHPHRLLPLFVALLVLNVGVLAVWCGLRRLQSGQWWRWLALQGALSPDLLLSLLARHALKVALLGGVALAAGLGPTGLAPFVLPVTLMALTGVGLGVLATVAGRGVALLLWTSLHVALLPLIVTSEISIPGEGARLWLVAGVVGLGLVLLVGVALRHRLAFWYHGENCR